MNLNKLAKKYKSDKYGSHFYTPIYQKYMWSKKNKKINIFEIGVGGLEPKVGYSGINTGGESLKMWRDFFKKGKIVGLDIVKKNLKLGKRVEIFHGSQNDSLILDKIIKKYKKFDFIIDDGSHNYKDVKYSFEYLLHSLNDGGYYFIEDTQSSYIRELGGDGANLDNQKTVINYFKKIIDKINHKEIENPYYKQNFFDKNITEIHFYHNLIVIKKDKNLEESNILINNRRLVGGKRMIKLRKFIKESKYFFLHLIANIRYFIRRII
jgi:demethylmacrocin O-methyltransferase